MFGWLLKRSDVKVPPASNRTEKDRDIAGLKLQREAILARSISNQIQETLARGVVLELRK
jgi:hypothetical protein